MTVVLVCLGFGAAALLGATAAYRRGLSYAVTARRMEETTATPASRVTPGFVEVKGRVKADGSLLTSPMAKKPCVYYRFHVEELVKRGKSSRSITRLDDRQDCGLLVEDAWQGEIQVNVSAADLMIQPDGRAVNFTFTSTRWSGDPMAPA